MSDAWRIIGARFIDPIDGPRPDERELLIERGRIVDHLSDPASAETFDAHGLTAVPGAIDMHTHLVGPAMRVAQELCPDSIPGCDELAWQYAQLGYTAVIDAAIAPSQADQANAQLDHLAAIDSGHLLLIDRHPDLLTLLKSGDRSAAIDLIGQWIKRCRAYGIKTVACPPQDDSDRHGMLPWLWQAAEYWKLPHPLHIHASGLGTPNAMAQLEQTVLAAQGRPLHLAHIQFHAYDITGQGRLVRQVDRLLQLLWEHPNVTADLGAVMPGATCTLSADRRLQDSLRQINLRQGITAWQTIDARDAAWAVQPFEYRLDNPAHAMQWAIGLELALQAPPGRLSLSMDHPNGGTLASYPDLFSLLTDAAMRIDWLAKTPRSVQQQTSLGKLDRSMTFVDLLRLTRTNPAMALGLKQSGNAGLAFYETAPDGRPRSWRVTHLMNHGEWKIVRGQRLTDASPGTRLIADVHAAG